MEFNTKWDWETIMAFNSKASESPRKMLSADWMIIDDGGENDAGSFNLSADGGNSGTTGSYVGHGSSTKSSISASADSSLKDGLKQPSPEVEASANFIKKMEMARSDMSGNSPPLEGSVGSAEPWISLKLRKRTYFENSGAGSNIESVTTTSVMPTSSTTATKKTKSSGQNVPIAYCQVEGCNVDLSTAKEYHRKHKVCDEHSKCPRVIVAGVERRFCQQCSRFHSLSEFDEKKRSCRRRLSDHNARRRKPPQETIEFNSSRLSLPFYDGRRHVNFLLNSPPIHPRTAANSTWDSSCTPKFALTRDLPAKPRRAGGAEGDLLLSGIKTPHGINMNGDTSNGFFASKGPTSEVLNPGFKGPTILSNMDAAQEYRCALSLLSNNSWASSPESVPPNHTMHQNDPVMSQQANQSIAGGVHLTSSEFWLTGQQSTHPRSYAMAANSSFQEFQVFKAPYEADFYSNALN